MDGKKKTTNDHGAAGANSGPASHTPQRPPARALAYQLTTVARGHRRVPARHKQDAQLSQLVDAPAQEVCIMIVTPLALSSQRACEELRHLPSALGRLGIPLIALMYSSAGRTGVMVSAICKLQGRAEVVAHLACKTVFVA
jgi:hypothetical protein